MNNGTFIGHVGNDAELKYTNNGKAVATFSLAVANGKDAQGNERVPTWVKATLWEKRAEGLAKHITKGKCVAVVGPVSAEAWIDKTTGEARSKLCVTVREFDFCGGGGDRQRSDDSTPQDAGDPGIRDEDIPF